MKNKLIEKILKNKGSILFWATGFLAFLWVVVRSGTNPKRLAYPCQKAAYPLAASWLIALVGISTSTIILKKVLKFSVPVIIIFISSWFLISASQSKKTVIADSYPVWVSESPVSSVFVYDNVPATSGSLNAANASVPDKNLSDPGIDSLIKIMNVRNTPFFKTAQATNGIVGKNDVVIIKANFQWRNRMSTNTDRIKGVVWKILNHPEGFDGEILVCDNGSGQVQNESYFCGFSEHANNSDDTQQSVLDVTNTFKAKGYPVDYFEWDELNNSIVAEYNDGNLNDGYVYNSATKVNYPKFKTPKGNYVSLKNGIWDNQAKAFNNNRLTIINMPVLKAHGLAGATIAVKNWIGVMNNTKSDSWFGGHVDATFHPNYCFNSYALPARVMDEVWPKLNIVDATWTAPANNYSFEQTSFNTKTVLASTDPVAVSWYAAKYILTPVASNPSSTNPDLDNGGFGTILTHWYNYFATKTSRKVTKDPAKISVYGKESLGLSSVADNKADMALTAYPNPSANGLFTVETEANSTISDFSITDINGKTIGQFKADGTKTQIDLSGYPASNYFLVYKQNNQHKSLKLVKGN
ncbi:MAG: DUF362 domain-containing protein [Bacteroidales bacterium]|nr:DUF362 domain-containing protein [Bacteroidales bacterium]